MIEQEIREDSRYGKDKSTAIDHNYIDSGEYRRKFDNISDNKELNKNLYQRAKKMLNHRSGTDFEDMYWFDENTGKEFTSITNMSIPSVVKYSPDFMKKYHDIKNKVTIHNHPRSMPPSMGDFESAYRNGYSFGVIAAHDGTVYIYRNLTKPQAELYDSITSNLRAMGYSEFGVEVMALEEMADRGILVFKEVN
ncbi:MAG: hypothetical protein LBM59_00640 [Ruminococcus sp.]|jgi:hypothetical protein|nr:hypothetical protein [Ruminococcus sp.]